MWGNYHPRNYPHIGPRYARPKSKLSTSIYHNKQIVAESIVNCKSIFEKLGELYSLCLEIGAVIHDPFRDELEAGDDVIIGKDYMELSSRERVRKNFMSLSNWIESRIIASGNISPLKASIDNIGETLRLLNDLHDRWVLFIEKQMDVLSDVKQRVAIINLTNKYEEIMNNVGDFDILPGINQGESLLSLVDYVEMGGNDYQKLIHLHGEKVRYLKNIIKFIMNSNKIFASPFFQKELEDLYIQKESFKSCKMQLPNKNRSNGLAFLFERIQDNMNYIYLFQLKTNIVNFENSYKLNQNERLLLEKTVWIKKTFEVLKADYDANHIIWETQIEGIKDQYEYLQNNGFPSFYFLLKNGYVNLNIRNPSSTSKIINTTKIRSELLGFEDLCRRLGERYEKIENFYDKSITFMTEPEIRLLSKKVKQINQEIKGKQLTNLTD